MQVKPRMATDIPAAITTPDLVETRLGTLRSFDGRPDEATGVLAHAETSSFCAPFFVNSRHHLQHARPRGLLRRNSAWQMNSLGADVPGKGWFVVLRLYGPLESWFDHTWRPGEIELLPSPGSMEDLSAAATTG